MPQRSRAQRLNGLFPLSYTGVVPVSPVNFVMDDRPPTINDSKNFYIGDLWLDISTTPPDVADLWMLVSLAGFNATWVNFGAGDLETLTGNTGGPVSPDGAGNINVVGDGTTINIVGNPGTNTLTVSAVGTGLVSSLTGNSGGAVGPTAGNINVVGTGVITIVGNPGTSTLTVTPSGSIASSFITNPATGTATPVLGVLTFAGTGGTTVSAAGSTVTINSTSGTLTGLLAQDGNTVTPTAGVIQVSGSNGLATTGTVGPNTLTVTLSPIPAFGAYVSAPINNVTGDGTFYTIIFDTEIYDIGGNFNNATGTFTAPVNGLYEFSCSISCQNITDQTDSDIVLLTPSYQYQVGFLSPVAVKRSDNIYCFDLAKTIQLVAGDTVNVQIAIAGGASAKTINVGGAAAPANPVITYFSGNLVH